MFSKKRYQDFFAHNNPDDEIYDALAKDDTAEMVMTVLNVLRKLNTLPVISESNKNMETSVIRRNIGNKAYMTCHYQKALTLYNEALMYAPKYSREMILAYSNRSALFAKLGVWTECHNDVKRCFAMGCPSDIEEKLIKRLNTAQLHLSRENFTTAIMSQGAENLLDFSSMKGNAQMPSVSSDIKIVTSKTMPRVTAATNIKVGAVLAAEQAYVSYTFPDNASFACHYCQKKVLDLIPCDGCCYALFCDKDCKNNCMMEYHGYECKIMDFLKYCEGNHMINLMIKTCLKLRKSCKSWDEFITASQNMGNKRIVSSTVQEVYDTNNKYSVLCSRDDRTFTYGALYKTSIVVAWFLDYLEDNLPSFLPKSADAKQQAKHALAKIMMFVGVHQKPFHIVDIHNNIRLDKSGYGPENFGIFPFISKLNNMCDPNTIIINKNNKFLLIAVRPINSGEELTVPFTWHRYDDIVVEKLNVSIFKIYGTVCICHRCTDSSQTEKCEESLSKDQKKYVSKLNLREIEMKINNIEVNRVYSDLVKALTILKDVRNSKEYIKIYKLWRKCLSFYELVIGGNKILDSNV